MTGICRLLKLEVQVAGGPDQLGTGASDGCTKVYHAARTKCRLDIKVGIVARDIRSAFQHLNRTYAATEISNHCPTLLQPFLVWYGRTGRHVWRTAAGDLHDIVANTGVDQGDPVAGPVYAVATAGPAEALRRDLSVHDPKASVFQVADDVQVATQTNLFATVAALTTQHWGTAGLTFNTGKDQCWSLDPQPLPDNAWQTKRVERMRCLGPDVSREDDDPAALPVAPDFEQTNAGADLAAARQKVTDLASGLARLKISGLPLQIAQHLFRIGSANLRQHIITCCQTGLS